MLPNAVTIEEYLAPSGFSAFGDWFDSLAPGAAAKTRWAADKARKKDEG